MRRLRMLLTPTRLVAAVLLAIIVTSCLLADVLAPAGPLVQDRGARFAAIGAPGHPLGTDYLGRDVLSRLLYGGREELFVALSATILALGVGVALGLVGGYFGWLAEMLTMRTVDVILAFPAIVVALLITTFTGPSSLTLIAVMGVLFVPQFARLTFAQVRVTSRLEYVDAARVFGAGSTNILIKTIVPNMIGPVTAQFSLTMAAAILLESGLSYLGLGVPAPNPSWGQMIAEGTRYLGSTFVPVGVPALAVVVTILCFSILGDALRDAFDPKEH